MRNVLARLSMLVAVSGCATVVRGTSEKFAIQTEPPGAKAVLSTGMACTTPCVLKLKRKDTFNVTFDKVGYQTAHAEVKTVQRSGAAFGNILAGGVIGAVVDAGNGSLKSLKPNPLKVIMVSADANAVAAMPTPVLNGPNGPSTGSVGATPQIAGPSATTTSGASTSTVATPSEATPR